MRKAAGSRRMAAASGAMACLACLGALAPSCSDAPAVSRSAQPYEGPPISIDPGGPEHVLVLSAPSGGWSFIFDQVKPAFARREVYVTVIRPNPAMMHTLTLVEQRLGTTVDKGTPIDVFARLDDYGANPSDVAYGPALRSDR